VSVVIQDRLADVDQGTIGTLTVERVLPAILHNLPMIE
jgi:hypothetical protein